MDYIKTPAEYRTIDEFPSVVDRRPDTTRQVQLPAGTVVVSADDHFAVKEDIFYERFPAGLRDRAPRIWTDGVVNHVGINGKSLLPEVFLSVAEENEVVIGS